MENKKDINDLAINPDNPRTISEFMEGKLIESILVFPQMLELRPILINKNNIIIGGNQRVSVLKKIAEMEQVDIENYLFNQKKFRKLSEQEKYELLNYWELWKETPIVPVRILDDLSVEEEKEILVKDNLHYGEDDVDILKQHFDRESIGDYLGTVAWNLYDYDDRMNDQMLDTKKTHPQKFKCGYVECQLTDEEFRLLNVALDKYLAKNDGISDGFLTYIMN